MRRFWKREAQSAAPLTAIADLRAALWSGMGQLAGEGFEKNTLAYRCVRMIAEAAWRQTSSTCRRSRWSVQSNGRGSMRRAC